MYEKAKHTWVNTVFILTGGMIVWTGVLAAMTVI